MQCLIVNIEVNSCYNLARSDTFGCCKLNQVGSKHLATHYNSESVVDILAIRNTEKEDREEEEEVAVAQG